jgi:hypothetical protein
VFAGELLGGDALFILLKHAFVSLGECVRRRSAHCVKSCDRCFFALGTQRVCADKTEFALVLVCSWYYMILAHLVFVFTSRSEHILSSAHIALHDPNRSALGSTWAFYGASDGIISTPMAIQVGSRDRLGYNLDISRGIRAE